MGLSGLLESFAHMDHADMHQTYHNNISQRSDLYIEWRAIRVEAHLLSEHSSHVWMAQSCQHFWVNVIFAWSSLMLCDCA